MRSKLSGSCPALVTPFADGKIDRKRFADLIEWHIAEGSHGLVVAGTTGEASTLDHNEHREAIDIVVTASAGRLPVIAGTGSNSTDEAISLSKHAQAAGADGVLVVTPYYNKPSQAGMIRHFGEIASAIDIELIIYNIPARSVVDMSVETMAKLAEIDNIVGVKDATGILDRAIDQAHACGGDFTQLSGCDETSNAFNSMGGVGCISVSANVAPRLSAQMQEACAGADYKRALEIARQLSPLNRAMFITSSPAPAKYALSLLGRCSEDVRLPLVTASTSEKKVIRDAMQSVGLI